MLEWTITDILEQYPNFLFYIEGDFNARCGILNDGDELLFEQTNLFASRKSLDKTTNIKGKNLCSIMENQGLLAINGRSQSDRPANFTDISAIGKSTMDFLWCHNQSLQNMKDFSVLNFIHLSDHLPIQLSLYKTQKKQNVLLDNSNDCQAYLVKTNKYTDSNFYQNFIFELDNHLKTNYNQNISYVINF